MPTANYQSNADGTFVLDYDPAHIGFANQLGAVVAGFHERGWDVQITAQEEQRRFFRLSATKGPDAYDLHIFAFDNFAWGNRGERLYEKRIQISRPYAEHRAEFEMNNDGQSKCLLIGTYVRDGRTIINAWNPSFYRNHGQSPACWFDIHAVSDAMKFGFGQYRLANGQVACAFTPDLLPFYVKNFTELHRNLLIGMPAEQAEHGAETEVIDAPMNAVPLDLPRNRILYGAPGTGKSHRLDGEVGAYFGAEPLHERVTFHPDYTYGQFVGAYRPVPLYRQVSDALLAADKATGAGKHEPVIDYAFVPGPFLRLLLRALKNPEHNFVLVIEELNRANAPAVFGEVFQLLDRDDQGIGKFSVTLPTEARDHLRSHGLSPAVRLPNNLYLWATMNSADQGVMPLDAAFKRRWSFEYVPLNESEGVTAGWMIHLNFLGQSIPWNAFRKAINDHLRGKEIPEDRLIGPFFMRQAELGSAQAFRNKLLLYLRDDVVRHNPEALFRGPSLSYGALADAYERSEPIFAEGIEFGEVI